MQELELKVQGGLIHEGGGVIAGFYGVLLKVVNMIMKLNPPLYI